MHSRIYYLYYETKQKDQLEQFDSEQLTQEEQTHLRSGLEEDILDEDSMYELIHSYCHCDYVAFQPDSELESDITLLQDALFNNNTNIKVQKNQIGYYFDVDIKTFTNFKFLYIESIKNQISDLLQNIHNDIRHTLYSISDIVERKYDIYFVDQDPSAYSFINMLLSLEFKNPEQIHRFYIIKTYDYHF